MRIRADRVLARDNDQAIVLADLIPLQPNEQEQAMTLEEDESRVNRAIEMTEGFVQENRCRVESNSAANPYRSNALAASAIFGPVRP